MLRGRSVVCAGLVVLVAAACGGGGGDPPIETVDLSGWWETWVQEEGTADPFRAIAVFRAADENGTFLFDAQVLTRTPSGVAGALPDAADPNREEWDVDLDPAGDLVGTLVTFANGDVFKRFNVRVARRDAPVGQFVISGTLADVHSHTSWARRYVPLYRTLEIIHSDPDTPVILVLGFYDPLPWAAITYDVGAAEIGAGVSVTRDQTTAISGHVAFTRLDDQRAEGSYDLELRDGEQATGSFSVEILVDIQP